MRIGLVCPYSFDVPGGVQYHVSDLAAELVARGHDARVLAPGEPDDSAPAYVTTTGRAVPLRYNGAVARVAFGPRAVAAVRQWLADGEFDVVHVHEPSTPSLSLLALWAADAPVVATFHYATSRSRLASSTAALLRPSMEKISARIAVSEAARATLVEHVGGEPVVIPNGLDWSTFATASPMPEWASPGPVIGFLGRINDARKGLAVLVRAFPDVRQAHPAARLLVAGPGAPDDDLLASGRQPGLTVLGELSATDRARLLASVDVFVAPHLGGESFGIVLVEAMAAGAPVLASDLPAFRDVLGSPPAGEVFPVGDAAALARILIRLLGDDQRRAALRLDGRERARRYDWPRIVPDIEAVYAAVARSPRLRQEQP